MAFKSKKVNPSAKSAKGGSKMMEPTIETTFCQAFATQQDMACEWFDKGSPPLFRQWNGQFWEHTTHQEMRVRTAQWLMIHAPHKNTASKVGSCVETLAAYMCAVNVLTQKPTNDVVVSTPKGYIHIDPQGLIRVCDPDPQLGLTHGITLSVGTAPGQVHVPKPLDPSSKFGKMMIHAHADPDVLAFVQEQCAAVLFPRTLSHAAWWYGVPGASKSTLAEMVASLSSKSVSLNFKQLNESFGLEGILGANLVRVDESDGGKIENESVFKTIVSGNGTSINRKSEKMIHNYHPQAKWIITCNDPPFIKDKSGGVERRLGIVEWCHQVPECDRQPHYHEVLLTEEGDLFLDWLLEGAIRIVKRGMKLPELSQRPEALKNVGQKIKEDSDSVWAWVHENKVTYSAQSWCKKESVYGHYEAWCHEAAREPLGREVFWRQLKGRRYIQGWSGSDRQVSEGRGVRVRQVPFDIQLGFR